ncbi:MAG TPA: DUF6132 family protein [Bacteroidales bacterium]|nr:DUF6132 family protein [Bacteroidales bacterium]HPR56792.1 DUF6132 family protein [Bacteroidales bacterium]HRW96004.1 DUF6132 family protein [Bacteroidales bacterium]
MTQPTWENKSNRLKSVIFKFIPLSTMIGILTGAIAGYIYFKQVVCVSGGCPLTSNPFITIIWGGLVGYLISDRFKKRKTSKPIEK